MVADDSFDPDALRATLKGRLMPSQKFQILRIDALPRNDMGKIDRQQLRAMMEASAAPARQE